MSRGRRPPGSGCGIGGCRCCDRRSGGTGSSRSPARFSRSRLVARSRTAGQDRSAAASIWQNVADGVRADAQAANEHYAQYEGKVQDAAQKVNDAYLKAFSEESGVQSYGEVADLLIAWYLQKTA